jgi:hypothetical protein
LYKLTPVVRWTRRHGLFPCQGRSNGVGEINRGSLVARAQLPTDAAVIVSQLAARRTRCDMHFHLAFLLAAKLPVDERANKLSGIFTPHQCWPCGFWLDHTLLRFQRACHNATSPCPVLQR